MPIALKTYTNPKKTAILVCDSDNYHLAKSGPVAIPELRDIAFQRGIIPKMAALNDAARHAGGKIFYRRMLRWPNSAGAIHNTPMARALAKTNSADLTLGSKSLEIIPDLAPQPGDFFYEISHGAMTSFHDSGLDSLLRNMGIETVIPIGVSINVAIVGATIEAVNRNYKCIVPMDCVSGVPADYGDAVLQHTIRALAIVTSSEQIASAWNAG